MQERGFVRQMENVSATGLMMQSGVSGTFSVVYGMMTARVASLQVDKGGRCVS